MNNNKKILTIVGLIIVVLFSFLLFFGINTDKKTDVEIASFLFTLLTEVIIFINILIITSKKLNAFAISGLSSSSVLYTFISLLFNIFIVGMFNSLRSILTFNFALLLIYAFIIVLIMSFKKENN